MIIWDLGKRCNFDCSYCTGYMHNNYSPHSSIEELKTTAAHLNEYYEIYKQHHSDDWTKATISFTGGEPVVNPAFFELAAHIKEQYSENFNLGLTTNGTWHPDKHQEILKYFSGMTISYHTEGPEKLKQRAKENMLLIKNSPDANTWLTVNVMMHAEHFEECVDLIENFLIPNDIAFTPRVIGDGSSFNSDWFPDTDGIMRKVVHTYDAWQLEYMKTFWDKKNAEVSGNKLQDSTTSTEEPQEKSLEPDYKEKSNQKQVGRKLGRMCCGGRTLCLRDSETKEWDKLKFVNDTRFKGWDCMVNWFFLHIEQGNDLVYHHQTCRADFNGATGPIGTITEFDKINLFLREQIEANGTIPIITCPNSMCGCGMCVPKSNDREAFQEMFDKHTIGIKGVYRDSTDLPE